MVKNVLRLGLQQEFERQVDILIKLGYPIPDLNPLKEKLKGLELPELDLEKGKLPFVIVVKSNLVETEKAMPGVTKLFPLKPKDFQPINSVQIPSSSVYLLADIDRGKENINLPPSRALKIITSQNRSPLTIDEGVALIIQYPQFLIKNNCFSLLASRHVGDKRVPAIWINSKKQANLGWCWDGNPHTWLGSASANERLGF